MPRLPSLVGQLRAYAGGYCLLAGLAAVTVWAATLAAALSAARPEPGSAPSADRAIVVPLVVVAAIALATASSALTRRRLPELRLARLRGASDLVLLRWATGPFLTAVTVGALAGVGVAAAILGRNGTVGGLGSAAPDGLGAAELVGAALATGGAGLVVAIAAASTAHRAPLTTSSAPAVVQEPVSGRTTRTVATVSLLVAAVVVAYVGARADRTTAVVLAGSGVFALLAGQLAVGVTRLFGRGRPRSTAALLGLRRVAAGRRSAIVRAGVAAGVVAVAAWSGASAAADWADQSARLRLGAPLSIELPDSGALQALALTERLDPAGRWLMAAAVSDARTEPELRMAYLDLSRYARVAGSFAGQEGAEAHGSLGPEQVAALVAGTPVSTVGGPRVATTAHTRHATTVRLDYVGDSGAIGSVELRLRPVRDVGAVSGSTSITDCLRACVAVRLTATRRVQLNTLTIGGQDLLPGGWVPSTDVSHGAGREPAPGGLELRRDTTYVPRARVVAQPVLVAGDPTWPESGPQVTSIDGTARVVTVVGERAALPLVIGAGVVGDLRLALAGAVPSVPAVRVLVLARADTPPEVLAGLATAGGAPPERIVDDGLLELGSTAADELALRRLIAIAAVLLGLICLLAAGGAIAREARRELVTLRAAGVSARTARAGALVEAASLAVVAGLATVGGGWACVRLLVSAPGLVPSSATGLMDPDPGAEPALVVGVAVASISLLVVVVARLLPGVPHGSSMPARHSASPLPEGGSRRAADATPQASRMASRIASRRSRREGGRVSGVPRREPPGRQGSPGSLGRFAIVATLLRGLRSRAMLSLGSVLMIALAVGATVLGPVFQEASVRSYTVTRVAGATDVETAVSWRVLQTRKPRPLADLTAAAMDEVAGLVPPGYGAPDVTQWAGPFPGLVRPADTVTFVARDDVCATLEVVGRCPERADEVLVSSEVIGALPIGAELSLPVAGDMTVVGTYTAPTTSADWLLPTLLVSVPPGPTRAARPAPYVVTADVVAAAPARSQYVLLDNRLTIARDLGPDDLASLVARVDAVGTTDERLDGGGRLVAETQLNSLGAVLDDARGESQAARDAVSPAVLSLVLVALAMLLRLLGAMAELRVPELTLAALRGADRRRLWALGLAEPAMLLLLGVPLGLGLGWLSARAVAHSWLLPQTPLSVPPATVVGAGVVVLLLAGAAVLAVRSGLRETLGERLSGVRRPRAGGRVAVVLEALLVALAVVLPVLRLISSSAGGLDLSALLLPVVVAIGAGLLVTRLATAVAQRASTRTTGGPLSMFVAVRALARRSEGTLVMLPVTAAIAVSVFAIGVGGAAADWRASVAATRTPAAEVFASPLTADETLALTHSLDPDGRSLMAAAEVTLTAGRAVLVDADRLAAVSTWSDQWLPGLGVADAAALITPPARPQTVTGRRLRLTLTNETEEAGDRPVAVQVTYFAADTGEQRALLGPFGAGTTTRSTVLYGCATGCDLTSLSVGGSIAQPIALHGRLVIDELSDAVGPVALAGYRTDARTAVFDDISTLDVDTGSGPGAVQLDSPMLDQPLPAIIGRRSADALRDGPDGPELALLGGSVPVVTAAGAEGAESLPLLGPRGLLFDLRTFTRQVAVAPELTTAYVLVSGDAPPELIDALAEAGLELDATYDQTVSELDASAYAQAMRLYQAVGVVILLAALGGLVVSFAVQLPGRRRDAAALRVVGVRPRTLALAAGWEAVVTLGLSAVAGLLAGIAAQALLLSSLTLGIADDASTPRVLPELDLARLATFAAVVLVGLLVFTLASSLVVVRRARGAALR